MQTKISLIEGVILKFFCKRAIVEHNSRADFAKKPSFP